MLFLSKHIPLVLHFHLNMALGKLTGSVVKSLNYIGSKKKIYIKQPTDTVYTFFFFYCYLTSLEAKLLTTSFTCWRFSNPFLLWW